MKSENPVQNENKINQVYLDTAEVIILAIDKKKKITLINRKGCDILGYEKEQIIGKNWFKDFIPQNTRKELNEVFQKLLNGKVETVEFYTNPVITKRGKKKYISWHNTVTKDINGNTLGILSTGIDVTEKKLAEDNFRILVEASPYGMIMTDSSGKITSINNQIEKILGYSKQELVGEKIENLIPERFSKNHVRFRKEFFKHPENRPMGAGRDLFAKRKDGTEVPVEIGLNIVKGKEEISILATLVDITERKKAETEIKENKETLEGIINNSPDAIIVYNEEGEIIRTNDEFDKLFALSYKTRITNIWQIIPTDHKLNFSDLLNKAKKGGKITDFEMDKLLGNGKRISVGIGLVYIHSREGMFIETVRDITERVNLRNKIMEFEKAQVVSKMAEGIAHHMGTPLASMLLRVQMLKEDITEEIHNKSMVDKLLSVEKNILYGQKIMQKLLRFASRPNNEKRKVDISALLYNASEIINPLCIKSGIQVNFETNDPQWVLGDPDMLELVFSDMMMNAIDAMPEGGTLDLSTEKKGSNVHLNISDTGTGIPEEILPFVFEPFFSSKPSGKGTGLGLSVAKQIINDHSGDINIKTAIGKGTVIKIVLPLYSEENV